MSNDPARDTPTTPLRPDVPTTPVERAGASEPGYALAPGTRIGEFRVVAPLGRGGMGEVYLAEQIEPVQRRVALKLIQGKVSTPLSVVYFEIERQALAQMQHPCIAQVFDAGTTNEGSPYFAMEYVEGRRLDDFAREEGLTPSQRLLLFIKICRGVQHAHQKSILHRDLKPGNVLVMRIDGEPQPKIIDFGIAVGARSAIQDRDPTTSERAGTPPYMSPEQAAGAGGLDTRSDVYSLGVMLFELLTDVSALAVTGASAGLYPTLAMTIAAAEPPTLENHRESAAAASVAMLDAAQRLPDELRHVLAKAVSPERERRYDSAAALADDLAAYREQRTLSAVPRTRRYVLRKFVQRNRLALAAATVAAMALLAGGTFATIGFVQAREQRARAEVEARKSTQIADFARQMLTSVDPDRARSMDRSLLRYVLDNAAKNAGKELAAEPAVLAAIEETIGLSYRALGEYALAEKSLQSAYDHLSPATDNAARLRLDYRLADIVADLGRMDESLARARVNLNARRAAFGPQHRDTLESLVLVASNERDLGKLDEAERDFKDAVASAEKALGPDEPITLSAMQGLAIVYADTNRPQPAEDLYKQVIARRTKRDGPEHSNTLSALNSLAINYMEQKRFADAEKILAPLLETEERVFGHEHPRTITGVANLAGALRQQGKVDESGPYYQRAYDSARKVYGAEHPGTIMATNNLGNYLRQAGRVDEAIAKQREAEAGSRKVLGADHPVTGAILDSLGEALTDAHRYDEAQQTYQSAYDLFKAKLGADNPRTRDTAEHMAAMFRAQGRDADAQRWSALAAAMPPKESKP